MSTEDSRIEEPLPIITFPVVPVPVDPLGCAYGRTHICQGEEPDQIALRTLPEDASTLTRVEWREEMSERDRKHAGLLWEAMGVDLVALGEITLDPACTTKRETQEPMRPRGWQGYIGDVTIHDGKFTAEDEEEYLVEGRQMYANKVVDKETGQEIDRSDLQARLPPTTIVLEEEKDEQDDGQFARYVAAVGIEVVPRSAEEVEQLAQAHLAKWRKIMEYPSMHGEVYFIVGASPVGSLKDYQLVIYRNVGEHGTKALYPNTTRTYDEVVSTLRMFVEGFKFGKSITTK